MQSIAETCVRFDVAHLSINLVSEIALPMFPTLITCTRYMFQFEHHSRGRGEIIIIIVIIIGAKFTDIVWCALWGSKESPPNET